MADNITKQNENIYTQPIGQGNLLLIDPNKIVKDGKIYDRLVNHEDLVMYANLTARLIPRSKLVVGEGASDSEVTVELFDGEINFLKPQNKTSLDTAWTDAFTDPSINNIIRTEEDGFAQTGDFSKRIQGSTDFQGFGITNINVKISASFTPQVTIQFTDIRGKTLFEQGDVATPYTAFFHLPYPTFYLTLKGYFGQAVRYQLSLISFKASFDASTGDYKVTCEFVGNHIALLRDITLQQAMVAPYMYPNVTTGAEDPNGGLGRKVLAEIYGIYKTKGLLPMDFPEITIWELIGKVNNFVKDIEANFVDVNLGLLDDQTLFQELLTNFYNAIFGDEGWITIWLDKNKVQILTTTTSQTNDNVSGSTKTVQAYKLNDSTSTDTSSPDDLIKKAEERLNTLLKDFESALRENPSFGALVPVGTFGSAENNRAENFSGELDNYSDTIKDVKGWYILQVLGSSYAEKHRRVQEEFEEEFNKQQEKLTEQLNQAFVETLEFYPSIRNLLGVVMAGADTFLRLMDLVHTKAYDKRFSEARIKSVTGYEKGEFQDTKDGEQICYPWPNYYETEEEKDSKELVLKYPGASGSLSQTKAFDLSLWPEVEFVEEYVKRVNFRKNNLVAGMKNEALVLDFIPLSVRSFPYNNIPYVPTKEKDDILWEIVDRILDFVCYGGMINYNGLDGTKQGDLAKAIGKNEATNLEAAVIQSISLRTTLQEEATTFVDLETYFKASSPIKLNNYYLGVINTPYIESRATTGNNIQDTNYGLFPQSSLTDVSVKNGETKAYNNLFNPIKTQTGPDDKWPFVGNNISWLKTRMADGVALNLSTLYTIGNEFGIQPETKVWGTNFKALFYSNWNWDSGKQSEVNLEALTTDLRGVMKDQYTSQGRFDELYEGKVDDINQQNLTEGILFDDSGDLDSQSVVGATSMLNTSWFANSILQSAEADRLGAAQPYKESAFLFLNSLPLTSVMEKTINKYVGQHQYSTYVSTLLKQVAAHHSFPYAFMLKLGSLWWRYQEVQYSGIDPITGITGNLGSGTPLTLDDLYAPVANGGLSYSYTTPTGAVLPGEDAENRTLGLWVPLIAATHYIITGKDLVDLTTYPNPSLNVNFNGGFQLSAESINDLNFVGGDGKNCKFVTTYATSSSVGTMGIDDGYANYTIYYPSAGDLNKSDLQYHTTLNSTNEIYAGSARFLWAESNYGLFNPTSYRIPNHAQYWKTIDSSRNEQNSWNAHLSGSTAQTTSLTGLLSIFPTQVLNVFRDEFLNFSEATNAGSKIVEGEFNSFKQIFQKMMVVETANGDTPATALDQYKNVLTVFKTFLNQQVVVKMGSANDLDTVTPVSGGLASAHQLLLWLINKIDPIYSSSGSTSTGSTNVPEKVVMEPDYQFEPFGTTAPFPNPGPCNVWVQMEGLNIGNTFVPTPFYVTNFFTEIDVDCTDSNIITFAPIIKYWIKEAVLGGGGNLTLDTFVSKVKPWFYDLPIKALLPAIYLEIDKLIKKVDPVADLKEEAKNDETPGVKADNLKLELYQAFKTLNDKWISGTQLGGEGVRDGVPYYNTLFERFMFLDRANRDIGQSAVIDIFYFQGIGTPDAPKPTQSIKQSIASVVSDICRLNYFNFIPLPAYVNFYAQTNSGDYQAQGNGMFGTHKVVDTTNTNPVYLCQYVGEPSKNLNIKTKGYGYTNDGFDISDTVPNPLLSKEPSDEEKPYSNKVMAFTVDFGIPNQNIFESITLDQSEFADTSEAFVITEQLGKQASGRPVATNSVNLFNLYKARNYKVNISCMGNVMIQPTTYFQLRYVPMFSGPYMVLETNHNITPNNIETSFVGTRVPIPNVPKITDLIMKVEDSLLKKLQSQTKKATPPPPANLDEHTLTETQVQEGEINVNVTAIPGVSFINPVDLNFVNYPVKAGQEFDPSGTGSRGRVHKGTDFSPKAEYKSTPITIRSPITGVIVDKVSSCTLASGKACGGGWGNHFKIERELIEMGSSAFQPSAVTKVKIIVAHLKSENISELDEGQLVTQSDPLGIMGTTGKSSGIHLHYEVIRYVVQDDFSVKEQYLDPEKLVST